MLQLNTEPHHPKLKIVILFCRSEDERMALGRFASSDVILYSNLPSHRQRGSKTDGQEETVPTDLAPYTLQLIHGGSERLYRSAGKAKRTCDEKYN